MACVTEKKHHFGRPEKPIDWSVVEDALKGGCTGTEIASYFSMHHDTFFDRVQKQYGMSFTAFAASVTPAGDMSIRMTQYRNALKGNTQLLLMLGEERLGQGRKRDIDVNEATLVNFDAFTKMMEARQSKSEDLKSSETNINAETKS